MKVLNKVLSFVIFSLSLILFVSLSFEYKVEASYVEPSQELRAVWVSPWGGDSDLCRYKNETDFKKNMTYILDTMEMYNLNTIIYHVRTHNDAMYVSKLNPVSSYWSSVNFSSFDPLTWMIEECHKRGIEFHAWLNPYRVESSTRLIKDVSADYKNFKDNPASDYNNLLQGTSTVILNPGIQKVRDFIVNTVLELMEGYDVDAIHFDDYFYCDMGASGKTSGSTTILQEPDQVTYEAYIDANPKSGYSKTSATNKANWRREQVDLFIEQLHNAMTKFNKENNRYVELGIAPTGIYKNGDGRVTYNSNGDAISTGSDTGGQTHYSSYLFCDTVKWINNEWIDYIMPQSYWGFTHPVAGYNNVMGWWNKVVKNKKVNLYSGLGLYMADSSSNTYSWKTDNEELKKQLEYIASGENIDGASIYNFHTFRKARDGGTTQSTVAVKNALSGSVWNNTVPQPEIKAFESVKLGKVQNLQVSGSTISFNKLDNAKFYVVYRSESEVKFSPEEVVDVFGSKSDKVTWTDKESGNFNYGIKALSYTNTLGEGQSEITIECNIKYYGFNNELLKDETLVKGSQVVAPKAPVVSGYTFMGWDKDVKTIEADTIVRAIYLNNSEICNIKYGKENKVVRFGEEVTITSTNPDFKKWVCDGEVVSYDKEFKFIAYKDLEFKEEVSGDNDGKILYFVQKYEMEGVSLINVQINNIDFKRIKVCSIYTLDGTDPLYNNCMKCNSCELENSSSFTCDKNAKLRFCVKINHMNLELYDYSELINYDK